MLTAIKLNHGIILSGVALSASQDLSSSSFFFFCDMGV
jgi:hypothetical protein